MGQNRSKIHGIPQINNNKKRTTMTLRLITKKATDIAAKYYQNAVAAQLQQTGLRYEDILNESQFEVQEALDLASPDVVIGRTRRLKRAIDLGFERKNLQDYAPNMKQDTFKTELYDDVVKVRSRDQEYALLNAYNK